MKGRTAADALDAYLQPLKASISCVSNQGLLTRRQPGSGTHYLLKLTGETVRLAADPPIALQLKQLVSVTHDPTDEKEGQHVARTLSYVYSALKHDRVTMLFSYQWHPGQDVGIPHLHVPIGNETHFKRFGKLHFPTGLVTLSRVIWLLIRDLKVRSRRPDWESVLERNHALEIASVM